MKNFMIKTILITIFIIIQIFPQQIDTLQNRNKKMLGMHSNNLGAFRVKNIKADSNIYLWKKLNGPNGGAVSGLKSFGDSIFAGIGYDIGTLYFSSNKGNSWVRSNFKSSEGIIDFQITGDSSLIFSSRRNGLYKSNDLFNFHNIRVPNCTTINALGKDNNNILYTGDFYWGGISSSSNNGYTWKVEYNFNGYLYSFHTTKLNSIIAPSSGKILRKNNGLWNEIGLNNMQIEVYLREDDSLIYLIPANRPYCLVSSDDGFTWVNHDTSGFLWGLYSRDITITKNTIIAGGGPDQMLPGWGIAVSDDKGYTWRYSNSGLPPYARVNKLTTSNNEVLAGLYGGGIY
ncbi:MAG TPA: hypothetical protein VK250_05720, partial [Nitrososphaeraceae archaeon]|nr:hypothetical protein [Nitrososphaeraceae archaeon]